LGVGRYWLSWPETEVVLSRALGTREVVELIRGVRPRFPAALWENWWQPEAERLKALRGVADGALPAAPELTLSPFSTGIVVWQLPPAALARLGATRLATATAAALRPIVEQGLGAAGGGAAAGEVNEQFYEAQNTFYGRTASNMLPLEGVAATFRGAAEHFLQLHGLPAAEARARAMEREVFCWASVHGVNSSHELHSHELASVSGVLYLETPPGCGALQFVDPRGDHLPEPGGLPAPPFVGQLAIAPRPGRLVLFPGWMRHRVARGSAAATNRMSVSCNLHGEWRDTAKMALRLEQSQPGGLVHFLRHSSEGGLSHGRGQPPEGTGGLLGDL
jgi:hypothetical protein